MAILDAEGLVGVLLILFWLWAILDVIATDASLCRNLPKGVWLILVLILPLIGSVAWLLLGRPEKAHWRPGSSDYANPRRPVGLEDHPRYSATQGVTERRSEELDKILEQWEAEHGGGEKRPELPAAGDASSDPELDEWEAELRDREAAIRRRELERRERELEARERELDED
jgi:hypothetical protein